MFLFINLNAAIRADNSAETAAQTISFIFKAHRVNPFFIQSFLGLDPGFGANPDTKETSLAFFFIYGYLSHFSATLS
jgi:hypothetical protein